MCVGDCGYSQNKENEKKTALHYDETLVVIITCRDQTQISKGSSVPAQMISPLGSRASEMNCVGVEAVIVRKLR